MSFKEEMIKSYKLSTHDQLNKIDRECSVLNRKGKIKPTYRPGSRYSYMISESDIVFKNTIIEFLLETRCIGKHRLGRYLTEIFGNIKDPKIYESVLNDLERENVIRQTTVKKWSRKTKHIQKEFDVEVGITPRATHRIVLAKEYYRKIKIANILNELKDED